MRTYRLAHSVLLVGLLVHAASAAQPALTIYNQDFAVIRQNVALDLQPGVNEVRCTDTTAHLEPDSVILRDPTGRHALQILEQNYRADPISQELLLSLFEGRTIDFLITGRDDPVPGRIVRSAYVPHQAAWNRYGQQYAMAQRRMMYPGGAAGQPIIEMDGRLRFGLPGVPLFPNLADDTILKPTLHWLIETDAAGKVDAELCYVTGGMSWEADYNVVAPADGDVLDLVGWITMDNQTGRAFQDARIKLMAGDVSKIQQPGMEPMSRGIRLDYNLGGEMRPPVTEKTFDEYHLYTLRRPTTLRDRETKQVEFVRAGGIESQRLYVYDGLQINYEWYRGWSFENIRQNRDYGANFQPKVWTMREFANTEANQLGLPLPAGRVRFYRRDDDGQLEFTGENNIDHTPRDETVRVYTGNAFDLVGQRIRTDFQIDTSAHWCDESFEIKLRNHKTEPVEIRVVEHLYRCRTWDIAEKSHDFTKLDSMTIEFRAQLPPDAEETITYKVHYTW
ncbi:MAG TPA: hypothetical protein VM243_04995 [Phycisphaerae bacterium]|nr:hypothetical protein [Phycisphaerae bacterium]